MVIKQKIWYAGHELTFYCEVDSCDEAQAHLDHEKNCGRVACATHYNGKHQMYSTLKMGDPEISKKPETKSISAKKFFRGVPGRGVDY